MGNFTSAMICTLVCFGSVVQAQHAEHDHDAHDHKHEVIAMTSGEEMLHLPDFPVTSADDVTLGLREMLPARAPVILSFTYTGCQSLCDVTNAILLGADDDLSEAGLPEVMIATLTIDPVNDTPQQLKATRDSLGSSERWLWLTAGVRGTKPLLDALRFPAGAIEDHDPVFLVGRACSGRFTRVVGLANPEDLVQLAVHLPECDT